MASQFMIAYITWPGTLLNNIYVVLFIKGKIVLSV